MLCREYTADTTYMVNNSITMIPIGSLCINNKGKVLKEPLDADSFQ